MRFSRFLSYTTVIAITAQRAVIAIAYKIQHAACTVLTKLIITPPLPERGPL